MIGQTNRQTDRQKDKQRLRIYIYTSMETQRCPDY